MRRRARNTIGWAVLIGLLSVLLDAAQRQTTIPASGTTTVSRSLGGKTVKVIIQTISVVNGSDMFPKGEWLAGVKEVTLVQNVEISVDGNDVFVSRSAFADLVNPTDLSVAASKGTFILTINGGDGAESYFIHIYFDAAKVTRRTLYSALTPASLAEDTRYRLSVLKDK